MADKKPEFDFENFTLGEAVRAFPGMYFGGTDKRGLHDLLWYTVDHALTEMTESGGNRFEVTLTDDLIQIEYNSAGFSIQRDESGRLTVESEFTQQQRRDRTHVPKNRRNFNRAIDSYIYIVVAACNEFTVQLKREGFLWQQHSQSDIWQPALQQVRPLAKEEQDRTTFLFEPDYSIFKQNQFDYDVIYRRLRECAYLLRGVTVILEDKRATKQQPAVQFRNPGGLVEFVKWMNRECQAIHDPIEIIETVAVNQKTEPTNYSVDIEIALQYAEIHQPVFLSFVNGLEVAVADDGPHIEGLVCALRRSITNFDDESKKLYYDRFCVAEDDLIGGLAVVISIWHPFPMFEGAIKVKLISADVKDIVRDAVVEAFEKFSAEHPDQMRQIVQKCLNNKALRDHRRYGELLPT